jgi:hypothetical protein
MSYRRKVDELSKQMNEMNEASGRAFASVASTVERIGRLLDRAEHPSALAAAEEPSLPRVIVTSVFAAGTKLRCAGPLAALPWNPHDARVQPTFEVGFNGQWVKVEITEWHQDIGWIAESTDSLDLEAVVAPRVELRK